MKLCDIKNEDDLREWLREQAPIIIDVELQWVEPAMGSSVGSADVIMKRRGVKIDVELKYLERTRKGTKFTVRPAQRRFHHMSMKRGGKTCLLAVEKCDDGNSLFIVRGDNIPLRDYASDPDSGCKQGFDQRWLLNFNGRDVVAIANLKKILFQEENFWKPDFHPLEIV